MSAPLDPLIDIPFPVRAHEHGVRADVFLSRRMKRMSRSLAARVIRHGGVRRAPDEPITKPSTRLFEGDTIILKRRRLVEAAPEDVVVPIVHQDARLVAVCKPGDLVVHPTASAYHRTLIRIMRSRLDNELLDLVHRIDKETSGLILLAKDVAASGYLMKQFAARTVEKSYLAIVHGVPEEDELKVEVPLRLVPNSLTSCLMQTGGEGAQPALTYLRVLSRGDGAALVEARPKTGRQHQIRVHLCHVGHPILGDKLYLGGEEYFVEAIRPEHPREELVARLGHDRQALHAWKMKFRHPDDGELMSLTAPPPPDLVELAQRLGLELP